MSRARVAAALGVLVYAGAWIFGAQPLYPVAVGLVLAALLATLWVRLAARPFHLRRRIGRREYHEGDDVWVTVELQAGSRLTPGTVLVRDRLERLGAREARAVRDGRVLRATYVLEGVPRGRYRFEDGEAVVEDPFGLERRVVPLHAPGALVVYPRLVALDRLFSETGRHALEGRRLLMRRPSGFDMHSVREHEQGESLRQVHWRTTARRGRLMVKELEDAPRDEIAVVLDAHEASTVGRPPDSSFDLAVRAAGSILLAHATRGRRASLVVNGASLESASLSTLEGDWHAALELLAAAEPNGRRPLTDVLGRDAAARSLELAVVTARLDPPLVDRLVQRAVQRHGVSLVWVDAPSFAGRPTRVEPGLLRLQAAGVAVAVLRRGDSLGAALGASAERRAAGA